MVTKHRLVDPVAAFGTVFGSRTFDWKDADRAYALSGPIGSISIIACLYARLPASSIYWADAFRIVIIFDRPIATAETFTVEEGAKLKREMISRNWML
jgi:hypothetical protein